MKHVIQVYKVAKETGMTPEMFCRRATAQFQVSKVFENHLVPIKSFLVTYHTAYVISC